MNLNKDDVARIVEQVLERLEINVEGETYSNERAIVLTLDGKEITRGVLFLKERRYNE